MGRGAQYNVRILKSYGGRAAKEHTRSLHPHIPSLHHTGIHANAPSSPHQTVTRGLHQCRLARLFPNGFNLRFYLVNLFRVSAPLVVGDLSFKLANLLGVLPVVREREH